MTKTGVNRYCFGPYSTAFIDTARQSGGSYKRNCDFNTHLNTKLIYKQTKE